VVLQDPVESMRPDQIVLVVDPILQSCRPPWYRPVSTKPIALFLEKVGIGFLSSALKDEDRESVTERR
jgi:hypothetical protein